MKKHSNMMQTELGVRMSKDINKSAFCMRGYLGVGWIRKFRIGSESYVSRLVDFIDSDYDLTVETFSASKNFISPEVGIMYAKKGFDVSLFYKGEFSKFSGDYLINELNASFRFSF